MVRIARERIDDLFALAEEEATTQRTPLADRYIVLARRIGMRYNVRLLPEYSELYCRGCSTFWVEGRTVRTRLRSGHRVRSCLVCGRARRVPFRRGRRGPLGRPWEAPSAALREDEALAGQVEPPLSRSLPEPESEED